MRFYCGKDYDEMSRKAANLISAQVLTKPDSVLGLATGSSPIGTYKELIRRYEMGDLDFSSIRTVNLDEYKGLSGDHEQSYRYFMDTHFFDYVYIDKANTNVPNGLAEDTDGECARYDDLIASMGGIDLQLLGIGHNGHIGFNEPEDIFRKETHCVALAESTINANSRLFEKKEDVPRYAFTMGIKNIMMARKIVMVISGEDKADIVAKAFFGPVTPQVPASILQLHPDVSIVGDAAAFSKISL